MSPTSIWTTRPLIASRSLRALVPAKNKSTRTKEPPNATGVRHDCPCSGCPAFEHSHFFFYASFEPVLLCFKIVAGLKIEPEAL